MISLLEASYRMLMTTRAQPYHVHFPEEESEAQGGQLRMQAGRSVDTNPRTKTLCLEIVCYIGVPFVANLVQDKTVCRREKRSVLRSFWTHPALASALTFSKALEGWRSQTPRWMADIPQGWILIQKSQDTHNLTSISRRDLPGIWVLAGGFLQTLRLKF